MASTTRKPGKKRIMVQVWGKLAAAIDRDFKALHLKRDSYLNSLFALEIEELAREVEFRNPDDFRDRLVSRKLPDRVKWTIELDETTEARLAEVLEAKNIPRDSFVNRVLFFLVAKKPALDFAGFWFERQGNVGAKPLDDVAGFLHDPFFHIRSMNQKFYTGLNFPDGPFGKAGPNLFALNTAVTEEDWEVFNSPPLDDDELLRDLGITFKAKVDHAAE